MQTSTFLNLYSSMYLKASLICSQYYSGIVAIVSQSYSFTDSDSYNLYYKINYNKVARVYSPLARLIQFSLSCLSISLNCPT